MDGRGQFGVFCLTIAVGFCGGIIYEFFAIFRKIFGCNRGRNKILGGILDLLFFLAFAIWCIFASFLGNFPSFRAYIWLGYAVGGILYSKILRRIVAFLEKLCYNVLNKMLKWQKSKRKLLKKQEKKL
jgi:hypothetical protein